MATSTATTVFAVSKQPLNKVGSGNTSSLILGGNLIGGPPREQSLRSRVVNTRGKRIKASAAVVTPPMDEIKEYHFFKNRTHLVFIRRFVLPTWSEFELGRAPVYCKTMNDLPPTALQRKKMPLPSKVNYCSSLTKALRFVGGFNQPIMCSGEPRAMLKKTRGKADPPLYTIQICIPKHALNLTFSFTNGKEWDGPCRLQFQVPKAWQNKPISFFNEGLAEKLSKAGACDRAIFPDPHVVIPRCAMIGNLTVEGVIPSPSKPLIDRIWGARFLNIGNTDPSSPLFNPDANVDDGSCSLDSDSEER
ncbi:hypothetical protein Cgig2_014576 [Carnegiea gigantea]|uniref:PIFI-like Ig-like domain-containing protein n=1 Tax=Carnegiea gigantea TaxID=171969 RepID=A0A9Q1L0A7_9CARY|nr:hypothetical protein Cgig2_014576 [Carnegiea gigantea]